MLADGRSSGVIPTELGLARNIVRRFVQASDPEKLLVHDGTGRRPTIVEAYARTFGNDGTPAAPMPPCCGTRSAFAATRPTARTCGLSEALSPDSLRTPKNNDSREWGAGMTPENAVAARNRQAVLTPENAAVLAEYASHVEHSPLSGHTPRTYPGAVRALPRLASRRRHRWRAAGRRHSKGLGSSRLPQLPSHVAKRATPTVNKYLAALVDFYTWRGLGQPQGVKRHQVARHAPKALEPRAKLRYLRAVEACRSA